MRKNLPAPIVAAPAAALFLTILAAAATAEPVTLTNAQLDQITAGAPPTLDVPATTYHGLPNNNPSRGGSSANPNGVGNNGGGGIHGIANNPGQSDTHPNADGVPGFANQLDSVHGGIGAANKNVGK